MNESAREIKGEMATVFLLCETGMQDKKDIY